MSGKSQIFKIQVFTMTICWKVLCDTGK
uniref:Uncharacterized protein n=1 Tax=Rhodnius prolixus TaxID=13249 RepID=T1HTG5_RHOPR